MLNYTKGNWEAYKGHDGKLPETLILAPNPATNKPNFVIAAITNIWPNHCETEANAQLIAAAPDMYEALKALAVIVECGEHHKGKELDAAFDAIHKAEGR